MDKIKNLMYILIVNIIIVHHKRGNVLFCPSGNILHRPCSTVKFIIKLLRFIQKGGVLIVFYKQFEAFCESVGEAPTSILRNIGVSKSAYTGWKNGAEPSNRTKKQVADYFGVSVADFMSGKTKQPLVNNDEELTELLEELKNRDEMKMLFKLAKNATKEDVLQAVRIIEAIRGKE